MSKPVRIVATFGAKNVGVVLTGEVMEPMFQRITDALFKHGIHWNGPVEPTGALVDDIVTAVLLPALTLDGVE